MGAPAEAALVAAPARLGTAARERAATRNGHRARGPIDPQRAAAGASRARPHLRTP